LAIEGQQAFDPTPERDRASRPWRQSHQDVVVHPIEEFLQIEIDDPAVLNRPGFAGGWLV
jgi:hypothetical protein